MLQSEKKNIKTGNSDKIRLLHMMMHHSISLSLLASQMMCTLCSIFIGSENLIYVFLNDAHQNEAKISQSLASCRYCDIDHT